MKLLNLFAAKSQVDNSRSGDCRRLKQAENESLHTISGGHFFRRILQMHRNFLTPCTIKRTQGKKLQADGVLSGRSMVEMLGVLAIIGVLSVGAIAGYQKAMFKYKLNKFMDQMTNIIANIRIAYGTQKTVEGLDCANIKKLGLVPDDMYKPADFGCPAHSWSTGDKMEGYINFGQPIEYGSRASVPGMFFIAMNGVPYDVCMALLTADWGSELFGIGANYTSGWPFLELRPGVAGEYVADEYFAKPGDKDYPAPYSVTRAEEVCSIPEKNGLSRGMTVYWAFKL